MVFLNQYLLSGVSVKPSLASDPQFKAPMFVTWSQCIVAVVFCFIVGRFRDAHPLLSGFPAFEYNTALALKAPPSAPS